MAPPPPQPFRRRPPDPDQQISRDRQGFLVTTDAYEPPPEHPGSIHPRGQSPAVPRGRLGSRYQSRGNLGAPPLAPRGPARLLARGGRDRGGHGRRRPRHQKQPSRQEYQSTSQHSLPKHTDETFNYNETQAGDDSGSSDGGPYTKFDEEQDVDFADVDVHVRAVDLATTPPPPPSATNPTVLASGTLGHTSQPVRRRPIHIRLRGRAVDPGPAPQPPPPPPPPPTLAPPVPVPETLTDNSQPVRRRPIHIRLKDRPVDPGRATTTPPPTMAPLVPAAETLTNTSQPVRRRPIHIRLKDRAPQGFEPSEDVDPPDHRPGLNPVHCLPARLPDNHPGLNLAHGSPARPPSRPITQTGDASYDPSAVAALGVQGAVGKLPPQRFTFDCSACEDIVGTHDPPPPAQRQVPFGVSGIHPFRAPAPDNYPTCHYHAEPVPPTTDHDARLARMMESLRRMELEHSKAEELEHKVELMEKRQKSQQPYFEEVEDEYDHHPVHLPNIGSSGSRMYPVPVPTPTVIQPQAQPQTQTQRSYFGDVPVVSQFDPVLDQNTGAADRFIPSQPGPVQNPPYWLDKKQGWLAASTATRAFIQKHPTTDLPAPVPAPAPFRDPAPFWAPAPAPAPAPFPTPAPVPAPLPRAQTARAAVSVIPPCPPSRTPSPPHPPSPAHTGAEWLRKQDQYLVECANYGVLRDARLLQQQRQQQQRQKSPTTALPAPVPAPPSPVPAPSPPRSMIPPLDPPAYVVIPKTIVIEPPVTSSFQRRSIERDGRSAGTSRGRWGPPKSASVDRSSPSRSGRTAGVARGDSRRLPGGLPDDGRTGAALRRLRAKAVEEQIKTAETEAANNPPPEPKPETEPEKPKGFKPKNKVLRIVPAKGKGGKEPGLKGATKKGKR